MDTSPITNFVEKNLNKIIVIICICLAILFIIVIIFSVKCGSCKAGLEGQMGPRGPPGQQGPDGPKGSIADGVLSYKMTTVISPENSSTRSISTSPFHWDPNVHDLIVFISGSSYTQTINLMASINIFLCPSNNPPPTNVDTCWLPTPSKNMSLFQNNNNVHLSMPLRVVEFTSKSVSPIPTTGSPTIGEFIMTLIPSPYTIFDENDIFNITIMTRQKSN
jgi:hypothetical protein